MPKTITIALIALLFSFSLSAQQVIDSAHTDYRPYKGKLIVINELHGVDGNNAAYSHVINQVATTAQPGDTLNLLIESSYSYAWLLNRYIHGEDDYTLNPKPYIAALRQARMPVRIIAADFEYDKGKRAGAYTCFLDAMIKDLDKQGVPSAPLKEYKRALWKDSTWQTPDRTFVTDFYSTQLKGLPTGSAAHQSVSDLLFVLNATHHINSTQVRDRHAYKRFLELASANNINYKGNYNLLIHGGVHTDLSLPWNIYQHFRKKQSSPFKDNVYSIGHVYVDCISNGDYFRQTRVRESSSLFMKPSKEKQLTNYVRATHGPRLAANSIINVADLPGVAVTEPYKPRIIGWMIQWQTE